MKKWILFFFLFTLLVLCSFFGYIYAYRAQFASSGLTKLFGTTVQIEKIQISPHGITLKDVVIENPAGSAIPNAFSTKKITLSLDMKEMLAAFFNVRAITINEIRIEESHIGIVMYGTSTSNWSLFLKLLGEKAASDVSARTFVVNKLVMQKVNIDFFDKTKSKRVKHGKAINNLELTSTTPHSFLESIQAIVKEIDAKAKDSIDRQKK